jgi:hypothetical protein
VGDNAGETADRTRAALFIWERALPLACTPVETYLKARSLALPNTEALRFARLRHGPSQAELPAMVALVRQGVTGHAIAIHRTFLRPDGKGKATAEPAKMALGPIAGGAVQLADPGHRPLLVGEGVETVLAAMQAVALPGWAALGTSGLRALELPADVREIIVVADGDEAGEEAATAAARRWVLEGRRVKIARPPQGEDFADLIARECGGR